ncbi:unknown [Bacteroides sp. CAG:1060]|nr:unknown [Bacteroides sp. CAG:1060]
MSSLTGMTVADYEDCSVKVRKAFNRDLERMLNGVELLMSVKEDGDNVFIYGHILPNGKEVEDVVISVPGDGALVCFFGRIDMDKVGTLVKMAEE